MKEFYSSIEYNWDSWHSINSCGDEGINYTGGIYYTSCIKNKESTILGEIFINAYKYGTTDWLYGHPIHIYEKHKC
jgi:hypothetical protein